MISDSDVPILLNKKDENTNRIFKEKTAKNTLINHILILALANVFYYLSLYGCPSEEMD